jgi:hypothetical protein
MFGSGFWFLRITLWIGALILRMQSLHGLPRFFHAHRHDTPHGFPRSSRPPPPPYPSPRPLRPPPPSRPPRTPSSRPTCSVRATTHSAPRTVSRRCWRRRAAASRHARPRRRRDTGGRNRCACGCGSGWGGCSACVRVCGGVWLRRDVRWSVLEFQSVSFGGTGSVPII